MTRGFLHSTQRIVRPPALAEEISPHCQSLLCNVRRHYHRMGLGRESRRCCFQLLLVGERDIERRRTFLLEKSMFA